MYNDGTSPAMGIDILYLNEHKRRENNMVFPTMATRFVGRWVVNENAAKTTAPGAYFDLAFSGQELIMHFETKWLLPPAPHLWVQVDDGARVEVPIDRHLRVWAKTPGNHTVRVIYKSANEMAHRWHEPFGGSVEFLGYDAEAPGKLPEPQKRKTIEFVGDSITEGILIDEALGDGIKWFGRPYQDDVTAAYAWLTAEALNLEPYIMGYGGVGVTKGGSGSVPRAQEAYPFCFDSAPVQYACPDYVLINHGANDRFSTTDAFCEGYRELLDVIAANNPASGIIVLAPFCGAHEDALETLVNNYNAENHTSIACIRTTNWIPKEPLHPDRRGHREICRRLVGQLHKLGI